MKREVCGSSAMRRMRTGPILLPPVPAENYWSTGAGWRAMSGPEVAIVIARLGDILTSTIATNLSIAVLHCRACTSSINILRTRRPDGPVVTLRPNRVTHSPRRFAGGVPCDRRQGATVGQWCAAPRCVGTIGPRFGRDHFGQLHIPAFREHRVADQSRLHRLGVLRRLRRHADRHRDDLGRGRGSFGAARDSRRMHRRVRRCGRHRQRPSDRDARCSTH